MRETPVRDEEPRRMPPSPSPADKLGAPDLPEAQGPPVPDGSNMHVSSFRAVLANRPFRSLWIAQVFSQFAQNLTWISLGAYVANQNATGKNTLVSIIIVSAMLAQLLLSGFAGVMVDRVSKRAVLVGSNAARVVITLLFVAATVLDVHTQTTAIIILIFVANAVAQFFSPAEAVTIPLLVEKRNLISASSLFNITFNACQVIPAVLGLVLLQFLHIVPVLLIIAACYAIAAAFVATLPARTTVARPAPVAGSLREAGAHLVNDLHEALRFLAHDPGLRLTMFQINVAPTFLFVFGTLGLTFVQETFGLPEDRAYILLLPAGVGLVVGALTVGRVAARVRKENLINIGLLTMGVAVAVLGAVASIVGAFEGAAGHVGRLISHVHQLPPSPRNPGLIPPAMVIAVVIGLAMALSTIPAQTLVFERTSEAVRGRVYAMQQLIGGAIPIIPLLTFAPLADVFGTSTIMTCLGIVIVLVGALSVHLDRGVRRKAGLPSPPQR
ncbi:MAG: MFS transporter [Chloroflexota bacterium]|nr:MFS transporter [Chloroflexota bacterium]